MTSPRPHTRESGFAMLVVFLLAAAIAISMYRELPRVVLEAQRDREEMLIDRGTQYKRAVQLYFRRFGRYPPDLDALENTNNIRFLRRRYKDPMTGEDEWRLIHAAGPGVFTDSLVYGQPGAQQTQTVSTASPEGEAETPLWLQRRPSDMVLTPAEALSASMPETPEPPPSFPQPVQPGSQINIQIPTAGQTAVATLSAAMQPGGEPGSNESALLPEPSPVGPPGPVGMPVPTLGEQGPSMPQSVAAPTLVPVPAPAPVPSATGNQQSAPAASNPALQLIQRLLTSPAPRSAASAVPTGILSQQPQIGGIAGVASKREAESIKVYNDRTKYNEWEFVYDVRQDPLAMAILMRQSQAVPQAPAGGGPGVVAPGTGPGRGPMMGPAGGRGGPGVMGPGRGGRGGFGGPGGVGPPGFGGPGGFGGPVPAFPGVPTPQQPGLGRGR